ncbi:hypothetical protein OBBRIDRAFT_836960 [Obba rivulosa]|uniref:Uncharacterized protein n=1 Tax=Obba rivulosa TaxID=1052685 RepID=A0A8E2ANH1_9APHY|nr:hypothetical protein OBBRIDRAFT_836960 [Obba rivulosa]
MSAQCATLEKSTSSARFRARGRTAARAGAPQEKALAPTGPGVTKYGGQDCTLEDREPTSPSVLAHAPSLCAVYPSPSRRAARGAVLRRGRACAVERAENPHRPISGGRTGHRCLFGVYTRADGSARFAHAITAHARDQDAGCQGAGPPGTGATLREG